MHNDEWQSAAEIRKFQIESGIDITFHEIFLPVYFSLFDKFKLNRVIDIGTGTGHLPLYLENLCNELVAIEPSAGMFKVAKNLLSNSGVSIENISSFDYKRLEYFDFAYSHMCAHTIKFIDDYFISIRSFICSKGIFVFSIAHPCFYNEYKNYFIDDYDYMKEMHKTVDLTLSNDKINVISNIPYYHRPISKYIRSLSNCGFVVVYLIEPWPNEDLQSLYNEPWKSPRYCFFVCSAIDIK